jgi:hypothetical protein
MDRAGLLQLRAEIDRLLETLEPRSGEAEDGETSEAEDLQELADRKVSALWERLGLNSRTFLSTCARRPAGGEFTLQDLADELGQPVASVRSWHRNLSRSLRRVEQRHPRPALLQQRWVEDRYHYWLSPEVQLAIRRQHPIKPLGEE